jgi:NAD(P)-dependent dehydrogenase (short-subunit alcohol dehydrogenase family)
MTSSASPTTGAMVVTGAARGIGKAIVANFAASGHSVIGLDLNQAQLEETMSALPGTGHEALAGDVRDEAFLTRACELAATKDGGMISFIANAGVAQPGSSQTYPMDAWDRLISINLTAVFLGARVALPFLDAERNGNIVMISSINGTLGMGGRAAYCAAKAGVQGLVRSLAVEWGPRGIRVNAISPGAISTEMQQEFFATGFAQPETFINRTPMGRLGQPSELADAVAYLASDKASFINGVNLAVDGGWAIYGLPGD